MCYTCGCNKPRDNHGDERNIIEEDIQAAADAEDGDIKKAKENIIVLLNNQKENNELGNPKDTYSDDNKE